MKQLFLVLISLVSFSKVSSQTKIVEDSILNNLALQIKKHWNIEIREDSLIIESKNSMWVDFYNIAGAPFDDPEYEKYSEEYLKENGRKVKAKILFKLEPKWTQARKEYVLKVNSLIYREIDSLIYKYNISHLKRSFRWHEEHFWGTTKEEDKRIDSYKMEKEKLMNKMIIIPSYNSEFYSLFIVDRNWMLSEVNSAHLVPVIFPETESIEIYNLEALFDELLANQNQ